MKSSPIFIILVFMTFGLGAQFPPSIFNSGMNPADQGDLLNIPSPNAKNHSSHFSDMDDVLDSLYYWTWDANNWLLNYGEFYVFNENGNILSLIQRTYENGIWNEQGLNTYSYDLNNNLINTLFQEWDGLNWVNYNQLVNVYDANGNLTSILSQNWNGSGWDNEYKQEFTYDGNNNLITSQSSLWIGGAWASGTRHSFSYDAQNRLTVHLAQVFILDWTNSQQILYTYDANGDLEMNLNQIWNGTGWDDSGRNLYDYDVNHNLISFESQNFEGGLWVSDYQFTYTYDSNNNITSLLIQYYFDGNWVNENRYIVTYDAEQNRITEVSQRWEDIWINQDSFHYYYSLFSSITQTAPEMHISVFPNPATSTLQIQNNDDAFEVSQISIYSSTGVKMGNAAIGDIANEIDISQYSPGSYYMFIRSEEGNAIRNFIKL